MKEVEHSLLRRKRSNVETVSPGLDGSCPGPRCRPTPAAPELSSALTVESRMVQRDGRAWGCRSVPDGSAPSRSDKVLGAEGVFSVDGPQMVQNLPDSVGRVRTQELTPRGGDRAWPTARRKRLSVSGQRLAQDSLWARRQVLQVCARVALS